MEETLVSKRPREEETQVEENLKGLDFEQDYPSKRHKHILSLLDLEEEEPTQDLSPLMTTLQQEITCASTQDTLLLLSPTHANDLDSLTITSLEDGATTTTTTPTSSQVLKEGEESDKERVMRHLLQASDDELGIPSSGDDDGVFGFGEDHGFDCGHGFSSFCDKLWELEDERANYYSFMQSELFLGGTLGM